MGKRKEFSFFSLTNTLHLCHIQTQIHMGINWDYSTTLSPVFLQLSGNSIKYIKEHMSLRNVPCFLLRGCFSNFLSFSGSWVVYQRANHKTAKGNVKHTHKNLPLSYSESFPHGN